MTCPEKGISAFAIFSIFFFPKHPTPALLRRRCKIRFVCSAYILIQPCCLIRNSKNHALNNFLATEISLQKLKSEDLQEIKYVQVNLDLYLTVGLKTVGEKMV